MNDEIKLTDEQVNLLSNDEHVKRLRTHFLKELAAVLKKSEWTERTADDHTNIERLKEEYEAAHDKLVQHVIDNPPTPMSIPVVSRRGFK